MRTKTESAGTNRLILRS